MQLFRVKIKEFIDPEDPDDSDFNLIRNSVNIIETGHGTKLTLESSYSL